MSIWIYKDKLKIGKKYHLSLNEGETPCKLCSKLSQKLGLEKIYIKREDTNPSGSFKDRSLAYQLSYYYQEGFKSFIISSSGNAAISAANYSKLFKNSLHIFISKNIPIEKLKRLLSVCGINDFDRSILMSDKKEIIIKGDISIYISKRPKSDSIKFKNYHKDAVYLRGSLDDTATIGFQTISYELANEAPDADAFFIPCSSGTSSVGIYNGYKDLKSPSIHIIQTTKIHPIASQFDREFKKSEKSISSAISDRVAKRKDQVINIIKKTNGFGWVISDEEIKNAQVILKSLCNIETSTDSALSLAGLQKALKSGYKIKRPILLLSGI